MSLQDEVAEERRLIRQSWALFRRDAGALILGVLLAGFAASVLGTLILSLLAGATHRRHGLLISVVAPALVIVMVVPMIGLAAAVTLRVRKGRRASARDAVKALRHFGVYAPAAVVSLAPPVAGPLLVWHFVSRDPFLLTVLMIALAWPFIYVIPVVADRRLGIRDALACNRRLLAVGGPARGLVSPLGLLPFAALTQFAPPPGALILPDMALQLVIAPLTLVYVVCMYFRAGGEQLLVDRAIALPGTTRASATKRSEPRLLK